MKGVQLVTGGAGYIGSHTIIEILENSDFEVVSVDNLSNSSTQTFDRIKKITGKKVKNYNVDLCNLEKTRTIFSENPDITGVIHFAAFKSVPESVEQPLKYYHNNIESLVNILSCLKEFSVKHFIFSSSCSVYGNIQQLPVNESVPLGRAESPYAQTKVIGEEILRDFCRVNPAIQSIVLRYFNPVGAHPSGMIGESPINPPSSLVPVINLVADGKQEKLIVTGNDHPTRDGTCVRDYIHVMDIARAHVDALTFLLQKKNRTNYDIFNLGTGSGVTVLEAVKSFEKINRLKLDYEIGERRSGDVSAIYSDPRKAADLLGWKTKYSLDDMMESSWKWQVYQKNEK